MHENTRHRLQSELKVELPQHAEPDGQPSESRPDCYIIASHQMTQSNSLRRMTSLLENRVGRQLQVPRSRRNRDDASIQAVLRVHNIGKHFRCVWLSALSYVCRETSIFARFGTSQRFFTAVVTISLVFKEGIDKPSTAIRSTARSQIQTTEQLHTKSKLVQVARAGISTSARSPAASSLSGSRRRFAGAASRTADDWRARQKSSDTAPAS